MFDETGAKNDQRNDVRVVYNRQKHKNKKAKANKTQQKQRITTISTDSYKQTKTNNSRNGSWKTKEHDMTNKYFSKQLVMSCHVLLRQ